ncbi:MAG TPA: ATP-binding protein [Usitatibacteraceae bacterium]|nr:ATP-binding protein [Usitatibacteraceae bacterium]
MRFKLVPYFSVASLVMFLLVALAMWWSATQQGAFFRKVQSDQGAFFKSVQDSFARQQEENARRDLLAIHESGNVNLTRLFANALWDKDFAPFVAKAQSIDVEACRAIADVPGKDGKPVASDEKKACFAGVGAKIREFKQFKELDAKVFDSMKKSTVFKIKVFDLRGITVYSSEHKQMGEDKSNNAGWKKAALEGKPASELTHRDKFSAFEGVVENRDLISSYLPVLAPGTDKIVGVFEVYSDVTPFLAQIKDSAAKTGKVAAENQAKVAGESAKNQVQVEESSNTGLMIVLGLLGILFASLFAIVKRADGIIRKQEKEREQTQHQLAQSEKMASLGQMVAGVAHQLNTPIAFSHNNVAMALDAVKGFEAPLKAAHHLAELVRKAPADQVTLDVAKLKPHVAQFDADANDVPMVKEMLGDTLNGIDQMRELVENLRDFTRLDRAKVTTFDLNKGLHNVMYIAKSVIPTRVNLVEEFGAIPAISCNPSQLNQVFLNLINNAAHAISGDGTITVKSSVDGKRVRVDVTDTGSGIAPDVLPHIFETYFTTKPAGEGTGLGLAIAQNIVSEHGGEIRVATEVGKGSTFSVWLPVAQT